MCKERGSFLTLVLPLIVALAVIFFVSSGQLANAKGVQKSGNSRSDSSSSGPSSQSSRDSDSSSSSSKSSSSNSNSGSSSSSSHGSSVGSSSSNGNSSDSSRGSSSGSSSSNKGSYNTQNETRHDPPSSQSRSQSSSYGNSSSQQTQHSNGSQGSGVSSQHNNNSSPSNSTSRSTSSSQQDDPRHKAPSSVTRRDASNDRPQTENNSSVTQHRDTPSSTGLKGSSNVGITNRSESRTRIQDRSEQRTSKVSPAGSYRKDYEDLSQIWRSRREKAESRRDSNRDHGGSHTNVNININFFPGSYRYYTYDYRAGYAYPSLYCYYYGFFPPYIYSHRVYYIHRVFPAVVYVEIPIIVFRDNYVDYDSYYSNGWRYRSVAEAVGDIEHAWERGDIDLLMDHVRRGDKIDISLKGEYAYSVDSEDYRDMTLDAMKNIDTVSFEFYDVKWHDSREAVAYGKHVYYDDYDSENGDRKTVYVKYRLEKSGAEWYITEVGTSPYELY